MKMFNDTSVFSSLELNEEQERYIFGELSECHSRMPAFFSLLERYQEVLQLYVRQGKLSLDDSCLVDFYKVRELWRTTDVRVKRDY